MSTRKEFIKYGIFMYAYWAMMVSASGMYSMYIIDMGFSKTEVGLTVTVCTFSSLLGQNFIGFLADRFRCVKPILLPSISIGFLVAAALFLSKQHWHIFIALVVWAFFVYGTFPLAEAWCISFLKAADAQHNFGKIRGMGSVGYGVTGVLAGLLLQNFGWGIYHWCIMAGVAFAIISILILKGNGEAAFYNGTRRGGGKTGNVSFADALKEIVRIKPLRSIIVIVFVYFFVVKGVYSYLGVLVSDFGGGPLSLGLTYFFDATPEVVTFFLTTKLMNRLHSKWLILIAFSLQIVRLTLILVFNSSLAIILLGMFSGFGYGLIASAYKTYIYELAPEKYKISCLSLSESIIGLSGVISAPVFGFAIVEFGGFTAIAAGLAINVVVFLILIKERLKFQKK